MQKTGRMLLAIVVLIGVAMSSIALGTQSNEPVGVERGEPAPYSGVLATHEDWYVLTSDQEALEDEVSDLRETVEKLRAALDARERQVFKLQGQVASIEAARWKHEELSNIRADDRKQCERRADVQKWIQVGTVAGCFVFLAAK